MTDLETMEEMLKRARVKYSVDKLVYDAKHTRLTIDPDDRIALLFDRRDGRLRKVTPFR